MLLVVVNGSIKCPVVKDKNGEEFGDYRWESGQINKRELPTFLDGRLKTGDMVQVLFPGKVEVKDYRGHQPGEEGYTCATTGHTRVVAVCTDCGVKVLSKRDEI